MYRRQKIEKENKDENEKKEIRETALRESQVIEMRWWGWKRCAR